MKAYENKTALLKSVLKTVMDPLVGLNERPHTMTVVIIYVDQLHTK